jgi:hypothetical protein
MKSPRSTNKISLFFPLTVGIALLLSLILHTVGSANDEITPQDLEDPYSIVFAPSGGSTGNTAHRSEYKVEFQPSATAIDPASSLYQAESELQVPVLEQSSDQLAEPSLGPLQLSTVVIPTDPVTLVKTTDTSAFTSPSPDPSGLAFLPSSNTLLICDGEVEEIVEEITHFDGVNLWETTLGGTVVNTANISDVAPTVVPMTNEPTGVAWNPANGHFFFTDDVTKQIFDLNPGPDTQYGTADDTFTTFNTLPMGSADPEGITYDSSRGFGHLLVIDGLGKEVYDINLRSNRSLDASDPVTNFDVLSFGISDPEGIEFNPDNQHLYILDRGGTLIAETTIDGTLIRYLDISSLNPVRPAGLAYAPASDGSGGMNLYIVDRGVDNNVGDDADPYENDGKMFEVSFEVDFNAIPSVDAGQNQTISFGTIADLDGTVSDDGNPDPPGEVTTTWSAVSVPQPGARVDFGDPSAVDTTATFHVPGDYTLRLTADDSELTNFDDVSISVQIVANQAPTVSAGSDQTVTLLEDATLNGNVTDDGLPNPPGSYTTLWSKSSGPGPVSFANAGAESTTASFTIDGGYVLRLTADDSDLTNFDEVTITVISGPNQAPVVDAGSAQTITLPDNAILDGTVSDDGQGNPPGRLDILWIESISPGLVTFADQQSEDTTATFSKPGVHELKLTAFDGEHYVEDTVIINVNPAPVQLIWLPIQLRFTSNQ